MIEDFGVDTVVQVAVLHDGIVVATFLHALLYLDGGADYTSLANGMGDLINIYLNYKHDLSAEETTEDAETSEDTTATDDEDTTATDDEDTTATDDEDTTATDDEDTTATDDATVTE